MSHSLNEIEAHAKRAARGAGLPWGMAEEAARATRWLASHELAGPALLADVLTQNDGLSQTQVAPGALEGVWHAPSGQLCPLAGGATLNDCADRLAANQPIEMADVSYPLLVLPFAAWAALHIKQPVRLTWQDVEIDTDGVGIWVRDPHSQINIEKTVALICQKAETRQDPANRPSLRGTVAPETWARLNNFAQRTYAPATDASRLLGAGAGTSDND
jgi:hypothetical protein